MGGGVIQFKEKGCAIRVNWTEDSGVDELSHSWADWESRTVLKQAAKPEWNLGGWGFPRRFGVQILATFDQKLWIRVC